MSDPSEYTAVEGRLAGVDTESLKAGEIDGGTYFRNGVPLAQWDFIKNVSGESSASADTSEYNTVKVIYREAADSTVTELTVDGITTDNYEYLTLSGSGITSYTGQSSFMLADGGSFATESGQYQLINRNDGGDRMVIYGDAGVNGIAGETLQRGALTEPNAELDSIEVSGIGVGSSKGVVEIWGRNI